MSAAQQTPSVQKPLVHCVGRLHEAPSGAPIEELEEEAAVEDDALEEATLDVALEDVSPDELVAPVEAEPTPLDADASDEVTAGELAVEALFVPLVGDPLVEVAPPAPPAVPDGRSKDVTSTQPESARATAGESARRTTT